MPDYDCEQQQPSLEDFFELLNYIRNKEGRGTKKIQFIRCGSKMGLLVRGQVDPKSKIRDEKHVYILAIIIRTILSSSSTTIPVFSSIDGYKGSKELDVSCDPVIYDIAEKRLGEPTFFM